MWLCFPRWSQALGPSPPEWTPRLRPPHPFLPPSPPCFPPPFPSTSISSSPWLFMPIASGWVWLPLALMPMVPPPRPGQSPALLGPGSGVRCVCAGGERAPSGEEPQECTRGWGGGGSALALPVQPPPSSSRPRRGEEAAFPLCFLTSPAGPPQDKPSLPWSHSWLLKETESGLSRTVPPTPHPRLLATPIFQNGVSAPDPVPLRRAPSSRPSPPSLSQPLPRSSPGLDV